MYGRQFAYYNLIIVDIPKIIEAYIVTAEFGK